MEINSRDTRGGIVSGVREERGHFTGSSVYCVILVILIKPIKFILLNSFRVSVIRENAIYLLNPTSQIQHEVHYFWETSPWTLVVFSFFIN